MGAVVYLNSRGWSSAYFSRAFPGFVECADFGEIDLQCRVIKGELVELEPQPNVLAAGFDLGKCHLQQSLIDPQSLEHRIYRIGIK